MWELAYRNEPSNYVTEYTIIVTAMFVRVYGLRRPKTASFHTLTQKHNPHKHYKLGVMNSSKEIIILLIK